MVTARLERDDWTLLVGCFDVLERLQVALAHLGDPRHPAYDSDAAATKASIFGATIPLERVVEEAYVQLDAIAGKVLDKHLGPKDALVVVSSRGAAGIHKRFFTNSWLEEQGHLVWRDGATGDSSLGSIDWTRTSAYAVGPGRIYVNLRGREPLGIVEESTMRELLDQLRSEFLAAVDPGSGNHVGRGAYVPALRPGAKDLVQADLLLGFAEGYAAAPAQLDGPRPAKPIVENNLELPRAGCDGLDPDFAPGAFLCNFPPDRLGLEARDGELDPTQVGPALLDLLQAGSSLEDQAIGGGNQPTSDQ
jgi:predicted AlkP superfamily phosphohydrolase/phosphomutase